MSELNILYFNILGENVLVNCIKGKIVTLSTQNLTSVMGDLSQRYKELSFTAV